MIKPKIKLIACDLDGTLLSEDHATVSQFNLNALRTASDAGIKIVIATGRTRWVFKEIAEKISVADYYIMSNGTVIQNAKNDKILFCDLLDYELWSRVYFLLRNYNAVFETYFNGKSYIPDFMYDNFKSPHISNDCVEELKSHLIKINGELPDIIKNKIEKFNVLFTPDEHIETLKKELYYNENISIASSIPGNIEINKKGINKGKALEWLGNYLGIEKKEIAAIGDNSNDKEMLEYADISFAVSNAPDYVKKSAKFITDSNDNDGAGKAILSLL